MSPHHPAWMLFGAVLMDVAPFYKRSLEIALAGIAGVLVYVLTTGHVNLGIHLAHRWPLLLNLLGLFIGFHVPAQLRWNDGLGVRD